MYGSSETGNARGTRGSDTRALLETIALIVLALAILVAASQGGSEPAPTPTQVHQVRAGENLWMLAKRYKASGETTEEALQRMTALNDLDSAGIAPGDSILVPADVELTTAQAMR